MTVTANCYVGAVAETVEDARSICRDIFYGEPLDLVHVEPAEDTEELPTFIFLFWADSSEQEEGSWLHDLFDLPNLPNMPCEIM